MENEIGLVLIHGAGLGSFIWNDLEPHLDCPTLIYDYPHRNQVAAITKHLRFRDYLDPLLEKISNWPIKKFVIVAHSIGGIPGLELAKTFPIALQALSASALLYLKKVNPFFPACHFPET